MNTDEYSRAAYALLGEGIILLRAHAGEGDVINRYCETVERLQAQRRDAAPAPAPDVAPPGFRIVGRSGPGVPMPVPSAWVRFARLSGCMSVTPAVSPVSQWGGRSHESFREMWDCGYYDLLEPIPAEPASPPPAVVPTCHPRCGKATRENCIADEDPQTHCCYAYTVTGPTPCFCTVKCAAAGRPLNPPPSDPVTVATAMEAAADFEQTAEEAAAELAADGVDVPAFTARLDAAVTVATGSVPTGYRLGDGWRAGRECHPGSGTTVLCAEPHVRAADYVRRNEDGNIVKGACAVHAVSLGALVPIDTARSVKATTSTCSVGATDGTRCERPANHDDPYWHQAGEYVWHSYPDTARSVPPGPVPMEGPKTCMYCGVKLGAQYMPAGNGQGWCSAACPGVCGSAQPTPPAPDRAPPPYPTSGGTVEPLPVEAALGRLRGAGWTVAVHNDYRQHGLPMTFWLLTHPDGRWVKGEGQTDDVALAVAWEQASVAAPPAAPASEPAVRPFNRIAALEAELDKSRDERAAVRAEVIAARAEVEQLRAQADVERREMSRETAGAVQQAESFQAERNQLQADIEVEQEGRLAFRKRHGARDDETFGAFVARLASERDSAQEKANETGCELDGVRAEVERLKARLADAVDTGERLFEGTMSARDQATARVRSMREAAAKAVRGWFGRGDVDADAAYLIRVLSAAIERLPLDTGTATDAGGAAGK